MQTRLISFYYRLYSVLLAIAAPFICAAHDDSTLLQLEGQLKQGTIDQTEYLQAVGNWFDDIFGSGVNFPKDTLIRMLETYRQEAWDKKSSSPYRINYYINLSNNANYANREGESIYFLEKAEQEIIQAHGEVPLLVAGRKCNTYLDKGHYPNVIATYQGVRDYIATFPTLLREENINFNIAASFIQVLHPTLLAYAQTGDATAAEEVLQLAEAIYRELLPRINPGSNTTFNIHFYMESMRQYRDFKILADRTISLRGLHRMEAVLADTTRPASFIAQLSPVWLNRAVEHFLHYQQNDSASHYLALLKSSPGVFTDHEYSILRFESQLLANQGDHAQAYKHLLDALAQRDSIQAILVNDIDEMLYAHTDAEFSRMALDRSEQDKRNQQFLIFGILLVSILTIASIIVVSRRRRLAAEAQIAKLNTIADFQITAMEEIKQQVARDEQKRLGRDLHDGLSSTLASLKHHITLLATEYPEAEFIPQLISLRDYVSEAYNISRDMSHSWYYPAQQQDLLTFEERVQAMMDIALPDKFFEKEIHVDQYALEHVPMTVRIELLRIVHEAITNIIKHTKAKWVSVLVYRENHTLILIVADDGKGSNPSRKEGLGIKSMKARSADLGGTLEVITNTRGTEVVASIPIND